MDDIQKRSEPCLFKEDSNWICFSHLINAMSNGVIAINDQGTIICFNSSAEKVFNIQAGAALGRPILDVLPNTGGKLLECIQFGKAFHGFRLKGQSVDIMANISPIITDHRTVGVISVFQEISEFEGMAKELDAYKKIIRQLNAVFESSYDGLFITDGTGKILKLNKSSERLNGHIIREVVGKNIKNIVEEGYIDRSVTLEVLKRKTPLTILQKLKNNTQIIVTGTPVFDESGNIDFVVTNERDISHLTLMKNQLQVDPGLTEITINPNEVQNNDIAGSEPIAISLKSREIFEAAQSLARFDTTVLILGESGTGKSFFAQHIHKLSQRKNDRFVKINCGAIPETLMESELFGYKKGAFTGADTSGKLGLAQIAHQGTLFFDEISELSVGMQIKLLTLLDDKEFTPVGGIVPVKTDVRIIAATNSDLGKKVAEGHFRKDLYYRLSVATIQIPQLKDRREDIPVLIRNFLKGFNQKHGLQKTMSPNVISALCTYHFPGNIRELQNIIERLVILCPNDEISIVDLSCKFIMESSPDAPEIAELRGTSLHQAVEEYERCLIVQALKQYGNKNKAARALRLDPSTLGRKAKKYLIPSDNAISH
jgi:PAS domain S-box-containing protein